MLKGKKIILRSFKENDATSLHDLKQDIEAYKAFLGYPFPSNTDSEKEWINSMYPPGLRNWEHQRAGVWKMRSNVSLRWGYELSDPIVLESTPLPVG